jgi:hypothetical protein
VAYLAILEGFDFIPVNRAIVQFLVFHQYVRCSNKNNSTNIRNHGKTFTPLPNSQDSKCEQKLMDFRTHYIIFSKFWISRFSSVPNLVGTKKALLLLPISWFLRKIKPVDYHVLNFEVTKKGYSRRIKQE